ncbi:hypothetical protein C9374_009732 [Naegleria lovaniensis]|uniref:Pleckstrin homology domain-containing protein n=1 Tax=Naegleria lovaniensis TaxID=51637 RepID=A0AA88GY58_NAELO|nr:uncharacterized protein C9374_009732 [Naegleria lovaniensis]KAG2393155.1 hypothetical protein C9374_009732 [Naegleria lovaniensis]
MNPASPSFVQSSPAVKTAGEVVQTPTNVSSQKPSFREKFRLSSPALSPIGPQTAAVEKSNLETGERGSSPSSHLIQINSSKNQRPLSLNLKELMISKKEKSQTDSIKQQAFSMDIQEISPQDGSISLIDSSSNRNEQTQHVIQDPVIDISSSNSEDDIKQEDVDELQEQLDRILNKRKEREEVLKETESSKRDETDDIVEMIKERRKNRENQESLEAVVHNIDVGELEFFNDDPANFTSNGTDVDIMNEFLTTSNLNSKDNSFVKESPKKPVIPQLALSTEVSQSYTLSPSKQLTEVEVKGLNESRHNLKDESLSPSHFIKEDSVPSHQQPEDGGEHKQGKGEITIGSIASLQSVVNPPSSSGVLGWRIQDKRWKMFAAPPTFMIHDVFNTLHSELDNAHLALGNHMYNTYQNEGIGSFSTPISTQQFERKIIGYNDNYIPPHKTVPQVESGMRTMPDQSQELYTKVIKPFKFKNLEDLFVNQFEIIGENGLRRFAFRYDLSGNIMRCLKTSQAWLPFLSMEEECLQKIVRGSYVFKNTPKGQVHKRFAFVDPKSRELTWSDSETKKKSSSSQRASRRVKLNDIVSIKVLEMTNEQARAMKIAIIPELNKRFYGVVIISRTRSVEFILYETRNFCFSLITGLALCVHKSSQNVQ